MLSDIKNIVTEKIMRQEENQRMKAALSVQIILTGFVLAPKCGDINVLDCSVKQIVENFEQRISNSYAVATVTKMIRNGYP